MAYDRINAGRGTWFQEQQTLINTATPAELKSLTDKFDENLQTAVENIQESYGVNVTKDWKKMLENPEIMQEYKTELLDPILEEFRNYPTTSNSERMHLESVAEQLESAWDEGVKSFIQESYNTATYLPLATLDFPALVKQYIKFLGKDIIPIQTASSTNIEQRIFVKYLVNNQTGGRSFR